VSAGSEAACVLVAIACAEVILFPFADKDWHEAEKSSPANKKSPFSSLANGAAGRSEEIGPRHREKY